MCGNWAPVWELYLRMRRRRYTSVKNVVQIYMNWGVGIKGTLSSFCGLTRNRHRQSRWIGSSIAQPTSRRKKNSTKAESLSPPPSERESTKGNGERKPSPKKRSTMKSRDAGYDFAALFHHPTEGEEKIGGGLEDNVSPTTSRAPSRRRGKRYAEEDDEENNSR